MDFDETPEEAAFRAEVRGFLEAYAVPFVAGSGGAEQAGDSSVSDETSIFITDAAAELAHVKRSCAWQRLKYEQGWAGITWPKAYGGRGGTGIQDGIFREEEAKHIRASGVFAVGIGMAGPTLIAHGTEEQKDRFLSPMLRGDEVWCQLFSEPSAGSDLGGLRMSAVRDGDEWIVNGQKVWNSGAHYSDWGILLTRIDVDAPKHRGITYFLVDMKSPGIEVRPLRQITGAAHFNEVFFTDVRIPHDQIVGEINGGWGPMMTTLSNERALIGAAQRGSFDEVIELARRCGVDRDPTIRQDMARAYTRNQILTFLGYRVRSAITRGEAPGPESSVLKLFLSQHLEHNGDLFMAIEGTAGMLAAADAIDHGRWQMEFLGQWSARIGGGTDQIQRNTIGEKVLGLPPEPRVDKNIAFRDIPG